MSNGNVIFMKEIAVWICPDCGFTFDASHTDEKDGGYSCPTCAEIRLEKRVEELEKQLSDTTFAKESFRSRHIADRGRIEALERENERLRQIDERESLITINLRKENDRLREEYAAMLKVLEWYGNKDNYTPVPYWSESPVSANYGRRARAVLASLQGVGE